MVPLFLISVLENEDDAVGNAIEHYIPIQPRLPTFDSFKEAIFDRIPEFENQPLYMFYFGKPNRCILNFSSVVMLPLPFSNKLS